MAKKGFMDGYKTYDPSTEGYGSSFDWKQAFKYRLGPEEAKRAVGNNSPRGILGVSITATWDEIKSAYRKLVMKHHPDKGGKPETFREIQGAYEILESQKI
jgi:DnaJ-class molecular chaperone